MPLANYKQYVNLVLGYAYYNLTTVGQVSEPTNWIHTDSIAPKIGRANRIPTNVQPNPEAICRECYAPAKYHPVTDGYFKCNRTPESIGQTQPDYGMFSNEYVEQPILYKGELYPPQVRLRLKKQPRVDEDTDANGVPFRSYEGPGTREDFTEWDATDYVSPLVEAEALDRWKDDDPNATTHALDYWYVKDNALVAKGQYTESAPQRQSRSITTEPETRNAYVEGFDGFIALRLIDEYLTSKHHEHTLNVFRDKQGNLRVGGIRIDHTVDGKVEAWCVNRNCGGRVSMDPATATRNDMESFIYGIIAHGNNHAAYWYTSRPTWYKLHAQDCAGNCPSHIAYCPVKTGKTNSVLTDDEIVAFLMDHNDKCRDANCKCDEVLIDMVPALAHL